MTIRDFKFTTDTVCICEPNRYERLYDGPVSKIPECLLKYEVLRYSISRATSNTYMEAFVR